MRLTPVIRRTETPSVSYHPINRLFDEFFSEWPFRSIQADRDTWQPAVDILEKDGNLVLKAELPGINEKDIDVKLEGNVLSLKGERKIENETDRNNYYQMESFYGSFTRSFTLPESVDIEHIKADYKNGILTISIPQKPEVKPREIPVAVH